MPSPPKPWEVSSGTASSSTVAAANTSSNGAVPSVPTRPASMMTSALNNASGLGTYGASGMYGSGLYNSSYSNPYSRLGGYGGYGSYGSYGGFGSYSPYNRFGSTYSPYNRFGYGVSPGPDEFSLTQRMEAGTRATFEIIEQIVGAFGGFAQMLDSTYMATHSSFMAMVGVAEQFGHLRTYLGQIFSIFALVRWIKRLLYKLTGRTPPPELLEQSQQESIQDGQNQEDNDQQGQGSVHEEQPVVSRRKSVLFFLSLVFGVPYLMYKLLQRSRPQIVSGKQELATALHDFIAESPMELNLKRGDTVQILSKHDPNTGEPSEWWQGRLSNGSVGLFPANYVQLRPNTNLVNEFSKKTL
ncbi:hypothetical protein VTP01DRAFT_4734 [Rhizomucor pusillus]|uniref:uncharacterized protein n=1 Tax=Rhizomucor pusillus TaxID=4840 RepID=UPI003742142C